LQSEDDDDAQKEKEKEKGKGKGKGKGKSIRSKPAKQLKKPVIAHSDTTLYLDAYEPLRKENAFINDMLEVIESNLTLNSVKEIKEGSAKLQKRPGNHSLLGRVFTGSLVSPAARKGLHFLGLFASRTLPEVQSLSEYAALEFAQKIYPNNNGSDDYGEISFLDDYFDDIAENLPRNSLPTFTPEEAFSAAQKQFSLFLKACGQHYRINVIGAAKLLSMVVLFSDGYLQLKQVIHNQNVNRFFQINLKLPLELQSIICNYAYGRKATFIPSNIFYQELANVFTDSP